MKAKGEFDVDLIAQSDAEFAAGRLTIEKVYRGDLVGEGKGQMLSKRTAVAGSAGYVAIEEVGGVLAGKTGSFTLQHSGTMTRGVQSLTVSIVPDSGEGELTGISGSLDIIIDNGKHYYEMVYTLGSD